MSDDHKQGTDQYDTNQRSKAISVSLDHCYLLRVLSLCVFTAWSVSCGNANSDVAQFRFEFRPMVGDQEAACQLQYDNLGAQNTSAQLADARLFVSSIELRRASDGLWQPFDLDPSIWQSGGIKGIALLDFEDGSGACADSGTAESNHYISGTIDDAAYNALRFNVGVPFELNHIDAALADAPFNVPGMYWTWQGGFKFLRVDWQISGDTPSRWNTHLGSTGCESVAPTMAPTRACRWPNLPRITLVDIDLSSDMISKVIEIDLAALVAQANLSENTPDSPPGCMSGPVDSDDCKPVFDSLGLDVESGTCVDDCASQSVFRE